VWAVVTGLKYVGLRVNKGNIGVVEDFNKIQYYKSCLKNPHAQVRTCSIGGLKLNERLLALCHLDSNTKRKQPFYSN